MPDPWDEFIKRAKVVVDSGNLDSGEVDYKVDISRKLGVAREAVLNGSEDWPSLVKKGISGHFIYNVQQSRFRNWIDNSPEGALRALREIWKQPDDLPVPHRIRAFCEEFQSSATRISGLGTRTTIISQLLMGLDVELYPPFRTNPFKEAYRSTGYEQPDQSSDEAALYEHALGFLDRFIEEARVRGLTLRHRLDAQSMVWLNQSRYSSDEEPKEDGLSETEDTPRIKQTEVDLATLANECWLEVGFLENIQTLLEDKLQVIFQGPPGTGKTYVAQKLAEHLAGSDERVTLVQFHPSYAYEDFVQGFRPKTTDDGQPGFELRDGPLLRAADHARREPECQALPRHRRDQPRQPRQGVRRALLPAGVPRQRNGPPVLEPGREIFAARKPLHHRDDEHRRPLHRDGGPRPAPPLLLRRVPPRRRSRQERPP